MKSKLDSKGILGSRYQLSNSERAFLSVLEKTVGSDYYILGKVGAFEVLRLETQSELLENAVDKIFEHYYFNYIVCARDSNKIICVVELEKLQKKSSIAQRKSLYLNGLMHRYCDEAKLSRLVVQEQRGYDLNELIGRFEAIVEWQDTTDNSFEAEQEVVDDRQVVDHQSAS